MTVSLTRYQFTKILPAFVNALEMLPNLHTLRICHAHSQMSTYLKSAFEGHVFPQKDRRLAIMHAQHPSQLSKCHRRYKCRRRWDQTHWRDLQRVSSGQAGRKLQGDRLYVEEYVFYLPVVPLMLNPRARLIIGLAKALPKLRSFGLMNINNTVRPFK